MTQPADPATARGRFPRRGWFDAFILLALAVGAGVASFQASGRVPQAAIVRDECIDVWFEGDVPYVFGSMVSALDIHHRRTNRHPLFSLVSYPPVKALRELGLEPLTAVRTSMAALAAVWLGALFVLLRFMGCRRMDATLFSLLAAASASAVFWFAVPETWAFGSLTILLALLMVARAAERPLSAAWYVIGSALTLSMTLTNWITGLVMIFTRFPWRRALRLTAAAFSLVLALWVVQKAMFPAAKLIPQRNQTAKFLFQPESGGPLQITADFLFHSMLMPAITDTSRVKRPGVRMTVQRSAPGSASWWGAIGVWVWAVLLGLGAWGALTAKPQRQLAIVLGVTLLGHLALHLVYGGEETFLYSVHWAPLLVVLAAFGTLTRARRAALALTGLLIVCAVMNNEVQFGTAVEHARQYTRQPAPSLTQPVAEHPGAQL